MTEKGGTKTRSVNEQQKRILDEETRRRRQQRQLDALEKDNHHDDPHAAFAHLLNKAKLPSFSDGLEKKKRKTRSNADHFKQRFRKNFQSLLEELVNHSIDSTHPPPPPPSTDESSSSTRKPSYFTAVVPPSNFPPRHFCAVCGFPSSYSCVTCGARYCCSKCLGTHTDTRCLKWTA